MISFILGIIIGYMFRDVIKLFVFFQALIPLFFHSGSIRLTGFKCRYLDKCIKYSSESTALALYFPSKRTHFLSYFLLKYIE